ncbi:MAG TPA: sulfite exporter TauE/SafE family protein [Steroidobacteraceae bacterium]|nr:sulfite exporter TauE/SafE family protein [Steroidobacteraceae bacterium]
MTFVILFLASVWAGAQNALAGGGSFITLPLLILSGMSPRAANITSTIALFPGQVASGWTGRSLAGGAAGLSLRTLVIISLVGGALGAALLLVTSPAFFARLLPWLILFATIVFAWGSFGPRREDPQHLGVAGVAAAQLCISVYGGYFGGGIGFLMLAALTASGVTMRAAGATKNVLAAVMNASAVAIFVFSPDVKWLTAAVYSAGAILGGILGGYMVRKVNERVLRLLVVLIGLTLTVGLFMRDG